MKTSFSRPILTGLVASLMMIASSQSLYAENVKVLGLLEAKGAIQVAASGAPAPIRLSNTTYSYIAGDVIRTGSGSGILNLEGIGRIGLAPESSLNVNEADMGVVITLESGGMAYALTPGSNVTIQVADMTLTPSRSPLQKVSTAGTEEQITGWVSIDKEGLVAVGAHSGDIEVTRGGSMQVVQAGQQSSLQFLGGRLIATQLGAGAGAASTFFTPTVILGTVITGVVGFGFIANEINSKDVTPVSQLTPVSP